MTRPARVDEPVARGVFGDATETREEPTSWKACELRGRADEIVIVVRPPATSGTPSNPARRSTCRGHVRRHPRPPGRHARARGNGASAFTQRRGPAMVPGGVRRRRGMERADGESCEDARDRVRCTGRWSPWSSSSWRWLLRRSPTSSPAERSHSPPSRRSVCRLERLPVANRGNRGSNEPLPPHWRSTWNAHIGTPVASLESSLCR